jgi:dTDP-4-amino-4,6-dideoxygalactose transaminase
MSDEGYELEYIREAFETNWIAPLGENVDRFEEEVADFVGVNFALALSSGTVALHLAVKLESVERDDIVFCSVLTFSATVNPVSYVSGKQVFIDSEKDNWNMDHKHFSICFRII